MKITSQFHSGAQCRFETAHSQQLWPPTFRSAKNYHIATNTISLQLLSRHVMGLAQLAFHAYPHLHLFTANSNVYCHEPQKWTMPHLLAHRRRRRRQRSVQRAALLELSRPLCKYSFTFISLGSSHLFCRHVIQFVQFNRILFSFQQNKLPGSPVASRDGSRGLLPETTLWPPHCVQCSWPATTSTPPRETEFRHAFSVLLGSVEQLASAASSAGTRREQESLMEPVGSG